MFSEDIHKITLARERKDYWMWNDGEDKVYTIISAYQKLQEANVAYQLQLPLESKYYPFYEVFLCGGLF